MTRPNFKIRNAETVQNLVDAIMILQDFEENYPERDGRNNGIMYALGETCGYCYRTKTQVVIQLQYE